MLTTTDAPTDSFHLAGPDQRDECPPSREARPDPPTTRQAPPSWRECFISLVVLGTAAAMTVIAGPLGAVGMTPAMFLAVVAVQGWPRRSIAVQTRPFRIDL